MSTQIGTSRAGRMSKDKHAKSTAASTAPAQTPSQTKTEKSAPKNQVSTPAHSQTISWRRNGHPVLRISVRFTEPDQYLCALQSKTEINVSRTDLYLDDLSCLSDRPLSEVSYTGISVLCVQALSTRRLLSHSTFCQQT